MAADHLGSSHYVPRPLPDLKSVPVLRQAPRAFQKEAGETEGSAILRAPTGAGKTEAALLWAQRNQRPNGRLFYVLPHTASINAMYKRLGPGLARERPGIFGGDTVGLLHSRATAALYSMLEGNGDDCSRLERQENAKAISGLAREMWFPIRVCTPHQILRYMLRGKGWETMLAEFPNSSFIFDEVHAYDPRIVGLILASAKLVSRWGARSLFVSATLPACVEVLIREALGSIPLIAPRAADAGDRQILDRKRHILTISDGSFLSNFEDLAQAIDSTRATLVVCNHVRTAQAVFERLRSRFGDGAQLLHSRFNQEDRNRIEAGLLSHPLPKVLIATQVVEVSLDLDFEQAFLEPAPIDAIVQRMGRVNRAGKRGPARVVIYAEQVNRNRLYCHCQGGHDATCRVQTSLQELRNLQNPVSEIDLVAATSAVYGSGYQGDDRQEFKEGFEHPDLVGFEDRLIAGAHQDWVEQVIESADNLVEVLPSSLIEEYQARRQRGLWIEANTLLVGLRFLPAIRARLDTSGDPWTVDCPYSSMTGLEL